MGWAQSVLTTHPFSRESTHRDPRIDKGARFETGTYSGQSGALGRSVALTFRLDGAGFVYMEQGQNAIGRRSLVIAYPTLVLGRPCAATPASNKVHKVRRGCQTIRMVWCQLWSIPCLFVGMRQTCQSGKVVDDERAKPPILKISANCWYQPVCLSLLFSCSCSCRANPRPRGQNGQQTANSKSANNRRRGAICVVGRRSYVGRRSLGTSGQDVRRRLWP